MFAKALLPAFSPKARRRVLAGVAALTLMTFAFFLARRIWRDVWELPATQLSFFEPHAGGCAWYRMDLPGKERDMLNVFPTDCNRPRMALAPNRKTALVWFGGEPGGESSQTLDVMVFEMELAAGKARRVPLPQPGELRDLGYDLSSRPVAFTINSDFELDLGHDGERFGPDALAATTIEYGGTSYPRSNYPDGTDALAHALAFDGKKWQISETAATRCCADKAPGIRVLKKYESRESDPLLAELAVKVHRLAPADPRRRKLAQHERFPFAPRDSLDFSVAGGYELVVETGNGARPWVVDAHDGRLAYFGPLAAGAAFWPPAAPSLVAK